MATTFSPYIQNELDQTNNFGFGEFNYKPFSDFVVGDKYFDKMWEANTMGVDYGKLSNQFGSGQGLYEKQGLASDVRHTLGTSAGKDAIIDWASQFGIDTSGKLANVIGNVGITAASAAHEIPDAWRIGKKAAGFGRLKKSNYDALLSGAFLSQPWEDVLANLDALSIPYGLDTNKKLDYIPNLQKWKMMNQRATDQGIAQVAAQRKIREAEAAQAAAAQVRANIQTYGNRDRPDTGMNRPGGGRGRSPTGGNVAGTPFARGGLIDLYRYGGFI